jgi:hypothetical protein
MPRRAFSLAAGALLVAGGVLGSAGSAAAVPDNCTRTVIGKTGSVKCTTGTGEFRAVLSCINIVNGETVDKIVYGPWRPVGSTSSASCVQFAPDYVGVEKR